MTVQGLEYSDPLHYTSFGSDTTDDGGMNLDIVPLKLGLATGTRNPEPDGFLLH